MKNRAGLGAWAGVLAGWALGMALGLGLASAARAEVAISDDVWRLAQRVQQASDAERLPFAVVDKRAAQLVVFHADGRLAGSAQALLGRDVGDDTVAGVGERAQQRSLRPGDATTPAGRFVSQPGRNRTGEAVVWVDWRAAFAIHRLRPGRTQATRAQRLASAEARDKRVSEGCVVVAVAFFEQVVLPVLGQQPAVVYVIPEAGLSAAPIGTAGVFSVR